MTAKEIKCINKEISRLSAKLVRLENEATNTAVKMSDIPGSKGPQDKIGNLVVQIECIQNRINNLKNIRNSALSRLSRDNFVENCLYIRLVLNYSWAEIAIKVGGNNTADGIRMMCERYSW